MLSAQCDELRAMAESVGLAMPQAATLMMDAADTIWELRNKCADLVGERERLFQANVEKNNEMLRLVRENAKLREDLEDQEGYDQILRDRLRQQTELCVKAEAENAKLRELVADMWPFVEGAMDDEYCPAPECPFTEPCTENQVCMASSGFHYLMCELGVEL